MHLGFVRAIRCISHPRLELDIPPRVVFYELVQPDFEFRGDTHRGYIKALFRWYSIQGSIDSSRQKLGV